MNNNGIKSTDSNLQENTQSDSKELRKDAFNRKPDLTYDLERVLIKLGIEIEEEIYN